MEWDLLNLSSEFKPGIAPVTESNNSFHIIISKEGILKITGEQPWRPINEIEWHWLNIETYSDHYLGQINDISIYAHDVESIPDNQESYELKSLRQLLNELDQPIFYLLGRAQQIVEWNRNHRFCGQCGLETITTNKDRSRKCLPCKQMFYPRLSPSIIVLVHRGEDILLAQNVNSRGAFYSTLAGFVEPGETIEETVHREVMEEVGIHIKNLKYFASQPWPFPNSLMLGFHAEYKSGDLILQPEEIADAQWFHYTNLPNKPNQAAISGWLIADFIKRISRTH